MTLVSNQYKNQIPKYEKLGLNISQALDLLLKENNIPTLSINYRIKNLNSFEQKIERKNYQNPLNDTEDICGVRIICYYQSDVDRIKQIVSKEFDVIDNFKKEEKLEFDQFGYRSTHLIMKIKKQWLVTPNYRGLENLKAELQIRTILMHAWAEIEHKLAYKSESQIPKEFRRKLSRISAKLEESDEQFEDLKIQIETNKTSIIKLAETEGFDTNVDFNLDTLQAFLDYSFPDREKRIKDTSTLFDEMIKYKLTLSFLLDAYHKSKPVLKEVEKMMMKQFNFKNETKDEKMWAQVGIARVSMALVNDDYYKKGNFEIESLKTYRDKINIA